MLLLESFQAGLSWECILNKRDNFKKAYDQFNLEKICSYDETKIEELLQNKGIIRNRLKIKASITNAKIFRQIQNEYGSFYNYLKIFTKDQIFYEWNQTRSDLSSSTIKIFFIRLLSTNLILLYHFSLYIYDN